MLSKTMFVMSGATWSIQFIISCHELGTGIYASEGNGRKDPWFYQDDEGKWHKTRGMKPIHFLKRAIEEHVDEYRRIAEQELQKG